MVRQAKAFLPSQSHSCYPGQVMLVKTGFLFFSFSALGNMKPT